jgi:site-specific DNA recombinase
VKGIHEPIISEGLFHEVQNVLDGRKPVHPSVHAAKEELPLRGFLLCRKCGCKLTGSASKGRGGKYFYYHCTSKCGERYRAEVANADFLIELKKSLPDEEDIVFFESIAADYYKKTGKAKSVNLKEIDDAIEKNRVRITNALRRMSDEEITPADYRDIKNLYEPEIEKQLRKKQDLSRVDDNLIGYITTVTKGLRKLPDYYQKASLATKQKVISSIYPEKLVYENRTYRTTRINEAVRLISRPERTLGVLEKGQVSENGDLSNWVVPTGFEPGQTVPKTVVLPLHHRTIN